MPSVSFSLPGYSGQGKGNISANESNISEGPVPVSTSVDAEETNVPAGLRMSSLLSVLGFSRKLSALMTHGMSSKLLSPDWQLDVASLPSMARPLKQRQELILLFRFILTIHSPLFQFRMLCSIPLHPLENRKGEILQSKPVCSEVTWTYIPGCKSH